MRVAGYIRVSSADQIEGYSLDAQQRAINAYCEVRGWQRPVYYADEGISARYDNVRKRPRFAAMLDAAEAGLYDVIIVHKLDRFARNQAVLHTTIQRLQKRRVALVSITEQLDLTSPTGHLTMSALGMLAEFFSHNLSMETRKGKAERKAQGLHNGPLPYGARLGADKVAEPDPETFPALLMMFQMSAEGATALDIAVKLNSLGYLSTRHGRRLWSGSTVTKVLHNRFYLGELRHEGGWIRGRHAERWTEFPRELWEAAQQSIERHSNWRHGISVRRDAQVHALTGIGRCYKCGATVRMAIGRKDGKLPIVRSYCRNRFGLGTCDSRLLVQHRYEPEIVAYLHDIRVPDDADLVIERMLGQDRPRSNTASIRRALDRLGEQYRWGDIEREEYLQERNRLRSLLDAAEPSLPSRSALLATLSLLQNVGSLYQAGTPEERNTILHTLFASIVFGPKGVLAFNLHPEVRSLLYIW